jgi:hypothetical protein
MRAIVMLPQGNSREDRQQALALRCQLAAICGEEPLTSFIEIRAFDARGTCRWQEFIPLHDPEYATARISSLASELNVYVGAAPRVRRSGKVKDVARAWCLWSDCDSDVSVAALRIFEPSPSIIIRSGSAKNVHAWWPLREAISPALACQANRQLALALGADTNPTHAAAILRPIGSLNHKHTPPAPVICVRLDSTAFRMADVVGGLLDSSECLQEPPPRHPQRFTGPRALRGLVRAVRQAQRTNRNNVLYWAARRVREHIDAGEMDESEAREARAMLFDAAIAAGLEAGRISATLRSALDRLQPDE